MADRRQFIEVYALGHLTVERQEILTLDGKWHVVAYVVQGFKSENDRWNKAFPGTPEARHAAIAFVKEQHGDEEDAE